MTPHGPAELVYLRFHRAVMPINPIFALLFLYSMFNMKIAKQFWLISAGFIITGILAVYDPINNFLYIQIFLLIFFVEIIRVFYLSILHKKDGAYLLGTGFALLFLFSSYDLLMDLDLIQPFYNIDNGYPFGFVGLILVISIYLSREFARINRKIIAQEISAREMAMKKRLLVAEDARKSKELEEARALQLSMLPQCVPELRSLDICFDMRTATEVGGDYYDYFMSDDGTVTFAIGDAMGHGMRAGMMVSIIKSLFLTQVSHLDSPDFFNKCSQVIRRMHLGNLFMAMLLVKIKNRKLIASSAGMPPIFIYRMKTRSVEEFVMKGMPLGAVDSFSYQTIETQLEPGDTVLLLSDGFSELFNECDEIFDYFRIKKTFQEAADMSSNQIVHHLFEAGDKWRNGRKQHDDITFVVFKIK